LIDGECGKRDEATFRRLYERLQRWGARLFCTDPFAVYDTVLPIGRGTPRQRPERHAGTQQQPPAALGGDLPS